MWKTTLFSILLLLMVIVNKSNGVPKKCEEREKSLALLELAKDSIVKAKALIPECVEKENRTDHNNSACGRKEKSAAYISVALKLINEAQTSYPTCDFENIAEPDEEKPDDISLAADCLEVLKRGNNKSGIYTIQIFNNTSSINQTVNVFCDMDTDSGGWTVIQRRGNFSIQEDFDRDWQSYKEGFGNISKDFWIGNEMIHTLTNIDINILRVEIGDVKGERAFAIYKDFNVANESDGYRLNIGEYSGNAGNSLTKSNRTRFSTHERNNDEGTACSSHHNGGWWYNACFYACNLNGLYNPGVAEWKNIFWNAWRINEGLLFSEMKIRKKFTL